MDRAKFSFVSLSLSGFKKSNIFHNYGRLQLGLWMEVNFYKVFAKIILEEKVLNS